MSDTNITQSAEEDMTLLGPAPTRKRTRAMSTHERPNNGATNVWLTPRWIIDALGPFDLDPCAATVRPWDCAIENYVEAEDGLRKDWMGFVWMNPPYGEQIGKWFAKMIEHRNGVSLTFARTETVAFQHALGEADAVLFPARRIMFIPDPRNPIDDVGNAGAPSVFMAFGMEGVARLLRCGIEGVFFFKGRRVADELQRSLLSEDVA